VFSLEEVSPLGSSHFFAMSNTAVMKSSYKLEIIVEKVILVIQSNS